MARTAPDFKWPIISSGLLTTACTWPPRSAVKASPPLLKLTVFNSVPVALESTVTAITSVVPPVAKAKVLGGFALASLTKSAAVFHGASPFTKNTKSSSIVFITGCTSVKVRALGLRMGVICVEPLTRMSVCGSALRLAAT